MRGTAFAVTTHVKREVHLKDGSVLSVVVGPVDVMLASFIQGQATPCIRIPHQDLDDVLDAIRHLRDIYRERGQTNESETA